MPVGITKGNNIMFKKKTTGSGIKDLNAIIPGLEFLEKIDYRTPYSINRPIENINYNVGKIIDFLEQSAVFNFSGGIFKNTIFDIDLSLEIVNGIQFLYLSPGAGVSRKTEIDIARADLVGKVIPNNVFFNNYIDVDLFSRILNKIIFPTNDIEFGNYNFEVKLTANGKFKARSFIDGTYDYFIGTGVDDLTNWEDDTVGFAKSFELIVYINASILRSNLYLNKIFTAFSGDVSLIPSLGIIPIPVAGKYLISTNELGEVVLVSTTWAGAPDPSVFTNDFYFVEITGTPGTYVLANTYDQRDFFARETQFNAGNVANTIVSKENGDGSITTLFNLFDDPDSRIQFWTGTGIGASKIMEITPTSVDIVVATTNVNVNSLNSTDPILTLNKNGTALSTNMAGIEIQRGIGLDSYYIVFDEETDTFKVGTSVDGIVKTSLQAIATRENTPLDGGVAIWNAATNRFDTASIGNSVVQALPVDMGVAVWDSTTNKLETRSDVKIGLVIDMLSPPTKTSLATLPSFTNKDAHLYNNKVYITNAFGVNFVIMDLSDNSFSTISGLTSMITSTSQIYNGKLYLPQSGGVNMDIVDLSNNSVTTISTLTAFTKNTSQIYNGKLYLPQSGGVNMDIVDLSNNSVTTISTLSNHNRYTSQIYNGKLYLPHSSILTGGNIADVVDLSNNSVTTLTLISNHNRFTSQIYNGKLYLPQSGGVNMDIVDLSNNSVTTISTLSSNDKYTSHIYNGKLYLPLRNSTNMDIVELSTNSKTTENILTNVNHDISFINLNKIYVPQYSGTNIDIVLLSNEYEKTTIDTATTINNTLTVTGTITGTTIKSTNLVGGNNTTLLGSIPYQSNVDVTTLLSPNTTTVKKFLTETGTGTNGAAPVWGNILDETGVTTGDVFYYDTTTSELKRIYGMRYNISEQIVEVKKIRVISNLEIPTPIITPAMSFTTLVGGSQIVLADANAPPGASTRVIQQETSPGVWGANIGLNTGITAITSTSYTFRAYYLNTEYAADSLYHTITGVAT